ncbi:GtrA family protein [Thiocapsa rosea]|uniref:GtrA-like protein n=1 Tax=Thiocapsa rosea TaxID=69360 RepID=A0A495V541_9GAMM|nr:GtrA family protein [Thiocapsa rosea]RKT44522.1 GtrA-like protein [Thiocapsa rosea]
MSKVHLLGGQGLIGDGLRFALVGAGNTAFTLLVFQLLLFWLSPLISYYLSWAIGLAVLLVAFPRYVFKGSSATVWRAASTVAIYLASLMIGGVLLSELTAFGINPRFGILIAIGFTTLFNFAASRLVYRLIRPNPV